jgi:hypothetical protein
VWFCVASILLIVLHVVCVTLTEAFLNNFVTNVVSFPKYVKWTHFLSCVDLSVWVGVLGGLCRKVES